MNENQQQIIVTNVSINIDTILDEETRSLREIQRQILSRCKQWKEEVNSPHQKEPVVISHYNPENKLRLNGPLFKDPKY